MNDEQRIIWAVAMAAALLSKVSALEAANMADAVADRYMLKFPKPAGGR